MGFARFPYPGGRFHPWWLRPVSGFVAFRLFAAWNSRVVAGRVRPGTVLPLLPGFALWSAIIWPSGLTSFVCARASAYAWVCVCASAWVCRWPQWPAARVLIGLQRARACACRLPLTTWPAQRIFHVRVVDPAQFCELIRA